MKWVDKATNENNSLVIFPHAQYHQYKGTISLTMYHKVIPLFLNLSQGFSQYQLEMALGLTSETAAVIFSYIARFRSTKFWRVAIDDFRRIVEVTDKYKNFAHLRQYLIDPAVKQINEVTDFDVSYTFTSKGRTVKMIEFKILPKKNAKPIDETIQKEDIANQLERLLAMSADEMRLYLGNLFNYYTLTAQQQNQILKGGEHLLSFLRADLYVQTGTIRDPDAYIAEAVFHYKESLEQVVYEAVVMEPLENTNQTNKTRSRPTRK